MPDTKPYFPHAIFLPGKHSDQPVPRVLVAPQRYIQGAGALAGMGRYLSLLNANRVGVLSSLRSQKSEGQILAASLQAANLTLVPGTFQGECSLEEIQLQVETFQPQNIDCLIAVGGGKCIDAGKAVAYRLGIPVVVSPSLASNDAPCSALSVLYSPAGTTTGSEFYPQNPALVVVDTDIIAQASERFLVAGMGDAMATWYEAQACLNNPRARTTIGARPTLAATAIGQVCSTTLFSQGLGAAQAVAASRVNADLEDVVEANTLLSGLGFESGGLAAAHSLASALTFLPGVEANYLHGEMVAIGTLVQLIIEHRLPELKKVMDFFIAVGLPVHLGQISVNPADASQLKILAESAVSVPYMRNMPVPVDEAMVISALLEMDKLGRDLAISRGDAAYRKLHAG